MSRVEVDKIQQQCGTTLTVGGGACKTAVVDATTVTLGRCGGTVSLASGATQSGFGRTGTVDWITTPKVTGDSPVTGVTGKGYFLNTTAGTITINLPAGSAGDIISMADYAATWQTYNVTVAADGSEKIGGDTNDAVLNTEGQSVTFVYVDGVQGWVNTMDSTSNVRGIPPFLAATGGTPCAGAECGDYKIHTFTGPGTLCVSNVAPGPSGNPNNVEYLVVAGGGGTGGTAGPACTAGGGAGAGGARFVAQSIAPLCYPAKPLCGSPTPANVITATVQGYPITVGGGGPGGNPGGSGCKTVGVNGSNSIFTTITSAGGGQGQLHPSTTGPENAGGSGGGNGGPGGDSGGNAGVGNTPPTTPAQGTPGGLQVGHPGNPSAGNSNTGGGGGGGMMVAGSCAGANPTNPGGAGDGGAGGGFPTAFGSNGESCGSYRYYAGGGGGGSYTPNPAPSPGGAGGVGGGGDGKLGSASPNDGVPATINTGGGGGAPGGQPAGSYHIGGSGGSGIVVIRYKFQ